MAEPDWGVWQTILQQIQADTGELKTSLARLDRRVDHIERDMKDLRVQFTYALGAATAADFRARELDARLDDVDERLKALETARAETH